MLDRISDGRRTGRVPDEPAPSKRAKQLRDEILGSTFTIDEAAYVLGLDRSTVAKYVRGGVLGAIQIGREWRIPENEIRSYVTRMASESSAKVMEGATSRTQLPAGFSAEVAGVLEAARQEASQMSHSRIGTEHLLIALASAEDCGAVLANSGATPEKLREALRRRAEGRPGERARVMDFTPRAHAAFRAAKRHAHIRSARMATPADLLAALLDADGGLGHRLLAELAVDGAEVRARLAESGTGST